MPRKRGSNKDASQKPLPERLAGLPRAPERALIGGMRMLPFAALQEATGVQPLLVLWMDAATGYVLAFGLVPKDESADGGVSEARELLYQAIEQPSASPAMLMIGREAIPAALPGRVVVNDELLAQAIREALAPLGVAVEYVAELPPFDEAFASLRGQLGVDEDEDEDEDEEEPFSWEIDLALLLPLFKAAASLYRRAPWTYLADLPPVVLDLGTHGPREGVSTLYASILGEAEALEGVAFYDSLEALDRVVEHAETHALPIAADITDEDLEMAASLLRSMGMPVDSMPEDALRSMIASALGEAEMSDEDEAALRQVAANSLVAWFSEREEADPTYVEWIHEHKLPTASKAATPTFLAMDENGQESPPNARETESLTLALDALNQFFTMYGRRLSEGASEPISYKVNVKTPAGAAPIAVSYTPAPPPTSPFSTLPDDEDEER